MGSYVRQKGRTMQDKLELLRQKLLGHENLAVAFSGGVDSTYLLLCAKDIFGEDLLAVTALAPNFDPDEIEQTKKICNEQEIRHLIINLGTELLDEIAHNPEDRCYVCKKSIFSALRETLSELGFDTLADGTNLDDANDYRPGQRALDELGVISPLRDAGFTKQDIRMGLKAMNVDIWDKPAYACLASRVPYGEEITIEKLNSIHGAEAALRELGFTQVRVRHHGDVARIEVPPNQRSRFFDEAFMDLVNNIVKKAGFKYASLDLGGYVMGSLNQGLASNDMKEAGGKE
jgi:pyridinium-3,5-biscarboxylic acid mononucleotide sulfurtransferase